MDTAYGKWLSNHFKGASRHYARLCKLDDRELKKGGSSQYYEEAHQMFGYVAALESCLKHLRAEKAGTVKPAPRKRARKSARKVK